MTRRTRRNLVIILFLSAVVGGSLFFSSRGRQTGQAVGWGRGNLKVSERTYYRNRAEQIGRNWRETARQAGRTREVGRIQEPYNVYLLIDTNKPAVWIENNGQLQQGNYADLPKNMKWKFYRSAPEGNEDLPEKVRLKIRGLYNSRIQPEMICLHGHGRGRDHLSFYFTSGHVSSDYGGSPNFPIQKYQGKGGKSDERYESIIVSDQEYAQYRRSLAAAGASADREAAPEEDTSRAEYRLGDWLKVERRLYQQIDAQVLRAGFELGKVQIVPGRDYSAARGKISAERSGLLNEYFHRTGEAELLLKIDCLGEDIWYVKSVPSRKRGGMRGESFDLELVLKATGQMTRSQYKKWITKGREEHPLVAEPTSQWKASLPNGVVVELLGICESPSIGRTWWGPNGNGLEYEPYFHGDTRVREREDQKSLDIAWKINWPSGTRKSGVKYTLDQAGGTAGTGGWHPPFDITVKTRSFDKSVRETVLKLGIKVANGPYEWVTFKNISLVPGKDFGFEIELGE